MYNTEQYIEALRNSKDLLFRMFMLIREKDMGIVITDKGLIIKDNQTGIFINYKFEEIQRMHDDWYKEAYEAREKLLMFDEEEE